MGIFQAIVAFLRAFFVGRAVLAAENLALRRQLTVLQRSVKRPNLTDAKVTQTASKRHFPGRRGCQPKREVPD